MTHDAHSAPPAGAKASLDALFNRQRWAPVGRQTLFLLTALPLALVVPVTTIALVSVGAGLAVLGVGLLLLLGAAALARWFGDLELRRLAWAGAAPIEAPDWPALSGLSLGQKMRLVLLDPKQWSYIAYAVLYLLLGTASGSLALVWVSSIVTGATRWIWNDWAATTPEDLAEIGWSLPVLWVEVIGDDDYRVYLGTLPFPVLARSRDVASRLVMLEELRPEILERAPILAEVDLRFEDRLIVRPAIEKIEAARAAAKQAAAARRAKKADPVEGEGTDGAGSEAPVQSTRRSVWDPQPKET